MKSFIPCTETWKEFFELYKNLPSLWRIQSEEYKNKSRKSKDWEMLLRKYKEIDSSANLQNLKSKLHNIRFCYKRELKKKYSSVRSRSSGNEEYNPILWYFHDIGFLQDAVSEMPKSSKKRSHIYTKKNEVDDCLIPEKNQKKRKTVHDHMKTKTITLKGASAHSHMESEQDSESEMLRNSTLETDENIMQDEVDDILIPKINLKKLKKIVNDNHMEKKTIVSKGVSPHIQMEFEQDSEFEIAESSTNEIDSNAMEHEVDDMLIPKISLKKRKTINESYMRPMTTVSEGVSAHMQKELEPEKDESEVFAACWAIQFRKLTTYQQMLAKKAIDDILFLGQIDQLSINTVQMPSTIDSTFASNIMLSPRDYK